MSQPIKPVFLSVTDHPDSSGLVGVGSGSDAFDALYAEQGENLCQMFTAKEDLPTIHHQGSTYLYGSSDSAYAVPAQPSSAVESLTLTNESGSWAIELVQPASPGFDPIQSLIDLGASMSDIPSQDAPSLPTGVEQTLVETAVRLPLIELGLAGHLDPATLSNLIDQLESGLSALQPQLTAVFGELGAEVQEAAIQLNSRPEAHQIAEWNLSSDQVSEFLYDAQHVQSYSTLDILFDAPEAVPLTLDMYGFSERSFDQVLAGHSIASGINSGASSADGADKLTFDRINEI